ncbi:hypothetical protein JCM5296_001615 [Sporobolomyces johnsonii]
MSSLKPLLPLSGLTIPSNSPSKHPQPSSHPRSSLFTALPPRRITLPFALISLALVLFFTSSSTSSSSSSRAPVSFWKDRSQSSQIHHRVSTSLASCTTGSSASALAPGQGASLYTPEQMEERWERATKPLPVGAGTEERLREWEVEAPGYEVEPADWVRKNIETCPAFRIHPNQNRDMLDKSHLLWSSMNTTQVMGLREEMIAYLRRREEEGALRQWGEGRVRDKGLVFTAGNADTFSRVLLTLKMLHHHLHSPLPSEIFSFPGEEPTKEDRAALEALGAKFRVVENAVKDATHVKSYHIKATAIIRSSFREVLYLDSDNIPTAGLSPVDAPVPKEVLEKAKEENRTADPWMRKQDGQEEEVWGKPAGLWEGKAYQRLGAMFWPDYWRTSADNPIWAILGVPCRDEWEQEAGQILIDKSKHLDALLLAEWMMDSSRFKFWFNFSDGDKDMFRFAFLALRKRWAVPGRYVSVGALPRNTMSGFCGHTMLQNDHLGKPMFVHANLLKQIPSGVGRGFAWGRHRQLRTQPSTLTLQTSYETSLELEAEDPLTDDDVDADMLANAGNDGIALGEVPEGQRGWRTRRRAAMEKGVRAQFHGGWVSALCIDYHYDDPRSDEELAHAKFSVAQSLPNPANLSLADLAADVDVCYTASPTGFELKLCDEDLTEVVQWDDDPRLRPFEDAFFEEGGKLNAKGF